MNIVNNSNCQNLLQGATTFDAYIIFDTRVCKFLPDDLEIVRVGDFQLFAPQEDDFFKFHAACLATRRITLYDRQGNSYEVDCIDPPERPSLEFVFTAKETAQL
ncbi:MAG: hypothetical protein LBE21_03865 [Pseudomonadales bacterium]|nr:hypothetical protein [Pseudomonadales bacterium]